MSKRCVLSTSRPSCRSLTQILLAALFILGVFSPWTVMAGEVSMSVEILEDHHPGEDAELSVFIHHSDTNTVLAGFSVLLSYDPYLLSIESVEEGDFLSRCEWEYFFTDMRDSVIFGGMTLGPTVKVVALASTSSGAFPYCPPDTTDELFRMRFSSSNSLAVPCHYAPVRFLWTNCGDNAIATPGGFALLSDRVYDAAGFDVTAPYESWPTFFGAPDVCFNNFPPDSINFRRVDFYHGGVFFDCNDTTVIDPPLAVARIEQVDDVHLGDTVSIGVMLDSVTAGMEFAGFDLNMRYDANCLTLMDVQPGELIEDCAWEYFTYRFEGSPDSLAFFEPHVKIVALAETNNGDQHPTCFADSEAQLARLVFMTTNDRSYTGMTSPIQWVWYECGDNLFSDPSGDTVFTSRRVYDYRGFDITASDTMPTLNGAPEACLMGPKPLHRGIDFYSGAVYLYTPEIDDRGDINLNGIAYEIADWVLFSIYFQDGPGVFTIMPDAQIAASDINYDGANLTLLDFVYLHQIIVGNALPLSEPTVPDRDSVMFFLDLDRETVSITSESELAALLLTFEGDIEPWPLFDVTGYDWWHVYDSGYTRVMVYPSMQSEGPTSLIERGPVFSYSGEGRLIAAEAANFSNTLYDCMITLSNQEYGSIAIGIDSTTAAPGGMAELDVLLYETSEPLAAFSLSMVYDIAPMMLLEVLPGYPLYDTCGWEYFTARIDSSGSCKPYCPGGRVKIIGMADMSGTFGHPACDITPGMTTSLARLSFMVSSDPAFANVTAPVKFFWDDCLDNTLSSIDGRTLFFADQVTESWGATIPPSDTFPSYGGPIDTCFHIEPFNSNTRIIDFYNGGVHILGEGDTTVLIGDINVNGVPYEIADALMFVGYFIFGPVVFPQPPEQSVANSDINGDGIPLTIPDLILMIRMIIMDLHDVPNVEPSPNLARFRWDGGRRVVSVDTPDSLGGVYFQFVGDIAPTLLQPQMDMQYRFDGVNTLIFITDFHGDFISTGEVISYTGSGELKEVITATHTGRPVETVLDTPTGVDDDLDGLPASIALRQNYPNPFNPTTEIRFTLPFASHAKIEIYNALGQKVETLVNRTLSAGEHAVEWNAAELSSGIYFYRLEADGYIGTKKMLLMK